MSHDDKQGEAERIAREVWKEQGWYSPSDMDDPSTSEWYLCVAAVKAGLARSAIGASAEKAMDRIVENSREQIDEAARNMGKAAAVGLGVGPIPAPVSHDAATPRTDAFAADNINGPDFVCADDCRQLERELTLSRWVAQSYKERLDAARSATVTIISDDRIAELWKQAGKEAAAQFFEHSFVPEERAKTAPTVPGCFARLLIAELAATESRDK